MGNDGVLVLGIGNVLMGDEGVGVHVVRRIEQAGVPDGVTCLDGGTGSFVLLGAMQQASRIVLVDATIDGNPPGTVRRLTPRFSSEYPPTLTAHDIGLKDLIDVVYLGGTNTDIVLYAISIAPLQGLGLELSSEISAHLPQIQEMVLAEATCCWQQHAVDDRGTSDCDPLCVARREPATTDARTGDPSPDHEVTSLSPQSVVALSGISNLS